MINLSYVRYEMDGEHNPWVIKNFYISILAKHINDLDSILEWFLYFSRDRLREIGLEYYDTNTSSCYLMTAKFIEYNYQHMDILFVHTVEGNRKRYFLATPGQATEMPPRW